VEFPIIASDDMNLINVHPDFSAKCAAILVFPTPDSPLNKIDISFVSPFVTCAINFSHFS